MNSQSILGNMNSTVMPCKMSFPGQNQPGIFLGYQKSETFFESFDN